MFPNDVRRCLNTLRAAGFQAHPVGGCVRDTLMGRIPGDWDVATSALPRQTMALFPRTLPTGLAHGTVTVLLERCSIEVTTFRLEEGYSDGRHPDRVRFQAGLTQDLARRDFTVNAMAFDVDGSVVDPFGGRADLEAGLIRAVGSPDIRFSEDALRVLRALRFAAQLDFSIEGATAAAMENQRAGLAQVSAQRIVAELEKTLLSPRPHWVGEFFRLGAMRRFGCEAVETDWPALAAIPPEAEARWPALCGLTGLDVGLLPLPRRIRNAVLHPHRGEEKKLALTGGELHALGLRGAEIGRAQKRLLRHVLAHPQDNNREALLQALKKSGD